MRPAPPPRPRTPPRTSAVAPRAATRNPAADERATSSLEEGLFVGFILVLFAGAGAWFVLMRDAGAPGLLAAPRRVGVEAEVAPAATRSAALRSTVERSTGASCTCGGGMSVAPSHYRPSAASTPADAEDSAKKSRRRARSPEHDGANLAAPLDSDHDRHGRGDAKHRAIHQGEGRQRAATAHRRQTPIFKKPYAASYALNRARESSVVLETSLPIPRPRTTIVADARGGSSRVTPRRALRRAIRAPRRPSSCNAVRNSTFGGRTCISVPDGPSRSQQCWPCQPSCSAQGFGLNEIGSCAVSRASATTGAPCQDASVIFWNPAAGTQLPKGISAYGGVASIEVGGDYTPDFSATGNSFRPNIPTSFPPHIFLNWNGAGRMPRVSACTCLTA